VRSAPAPLPSIEHPIVVGIDSSEHSMRALDEAAFLAADTRSLLRIVTAWERPVQDAWSAYQNVREAQRKKSQDDAPRRDEEDTWSAYHRVRQAVAGEGEREAVSYETLVAEISQQAADTAAQAAARVQARYPELKVETVISEGSAAQSIVKAAAGASLIVVGARGRSAMQALLLGSVSRKVMNQAECAVYVIR
jgi:nucleotide-binding universal stress UspA family protein